MEDEELTTGWYVHFDGKYPKWKVYLDVENKTYRGNGVDGGKLANVFDYIYMYDYIFGNCIKTEP